MVPTCHAQSIRVESAHLAGVGAVLSECTRYVTGGLVEAGVESFLADGSRPGKSNLNGGRCAG